MSRIERLNPATNVVVKTKPRPACRATASFSHMGGRPTQQDACQIWENPAIGSTFVVVCDGVGGSRSGAEASAVVVQTAGQLWKDRGGVFSDPKKDLLSLSNVARNRIADLAVAGEKRAPASTIVALYVTPTEAHWIHAGDSRLYHFRNSQLVTRTRDHSVVQILVDQGEVSEEEMGSHPDQGRLLQSLGTQEYREPTYGTAAIGQSDAFVLCTDGFWERTSPKAMASLFLAEPSNLESELRKVVGRAVQANGPSGDNVTAAIIAPSIPPAESPAGDFIKKLSSYLALCIAILAVAGVGVYKWMNPEPATVAVDQRSGGKATVAPASPKPATPVRANPTPPAASPDPSVVRTPAATATPPPVTPPRATPGSGLSGLPVAPIAPSPSLAPSNGLPPVAERVTPESATADHPFVNSLGMKFVPVEITGGATSGRRVLFSAWDTRVRDYEQYALAKKIALEVPLYGQGPEHPAVNVSWDDAKSFCHWLTKKDRDAAIIVGQQEYRLPSDHEWSCAVGIGSDERAEESPEDKSGGLSIYPWGTRWPPPKGVGNYVAASRGTSPVGSFAANRYGLYDMGGNVWQWCEDRFNAREESRVIRGASWHNQDETYLRSSFRFSADPAVRRNDVGFRCVLAVSDG